jgi:hypothetical protein
MKTKERITKMPTLKGRTNIPDIELAKEFSKIDDIKMETKLLKTLIGVINKIKEQGEAS